MKGKLIQKVIYVMIFALLFTGCSATTEEKSASSTNQATTGTGMSSTEASVQASSTEAANQNFEINEKFQSKALANNKLGDSSIEDINVYLPPSYYENTYRRYPCVLFLHGFEEAPTYFNTFSSTLKQYMQSEGNQEFIVVAPNGDNSLRGSFYHNSEATGNWEDYIVKEVVEFVDSKYRTIPNVTSRGICGFSMGGYGSLNIAMKHPDVFSSVYTISPGLIVDGDLENAMSTWGSGFQNAYGSAFSPNLKLETPFAGIPVFDGSEADNKIIKNWYSGYGDFKGKIQNYKSLDKKLTAIKLSVGSNDSYPWIYKGTVAFSTALKTEGIENTLTVTEDGHNIPGTFFEDFVQFFSKTLKAENK